MGEEVLGIIVPIEGARFRWNPLARRLGKYALFFTTERLVVAKLAGLTQLMSEIFGPLGNLYSNLTSAKPKDLARMNLDEILRIEKDNYAIPYLEIVKVSMGKGRVIETWGAILSTNKEKYNYTFYSEESYNQFVDIAKKVIPEKLSEHK